MQMNGANFSCGKIGAQRSAPLLNRMKAMVRLGSKSDVGFWHLADVSGAHQDVRFWPKSGHWEGDPYCTMTLAHNPICGMTLEALCSESAFCLRRTDV